MRSGRLLRMQIKNNLPLILVGLLIVVVLLYPSSSILPTAARGAVGVVMLNSSVLNVAEVWNAISEWANAVKTHTRLEVKTFTVENVEEAFRQNPNIKLWIYVGMADDSFPFWNLQDARLAHPPSGKYPLQLRDIKAKYNITISFVLIPQDCDFGNRIYYNKDGWRTVAVQTFKFFASYHRGALRFENVARGGVGEPPQDYIYNNASQFITALGLRNEVKIKPYKSEVLTGQPVYVWLCGHGVYACVWACRDGMVWTREFYGLKVGFLDVHGCQADEVPFNQYGSSDTGGAWFSLPLHGSAVLVYTSGENPLYYRNSSTGEGWLSYAWFYHPEVFVKGETFGESISKIEGLGGVFWGDLTFTL